jgi:hypothetical protein
VTACLGKRSAEAARPDRDRGGAWEPPERSPWRRRVEEGVLAWRRLLDDPGGIRMTKQAGPRTTPTSPRAHIVVEPAAMASAPGHRLARPRAQRRQAPMWGRARRRRTWCGHPRPSEWIGRALRLTSLLRASVRRPRGSLCQDRSEKIAGPPRHPFGRHPRWRSARRRYSVVPIQY